MKNKISISVSDASHDFTKDQRVVVKVGRDEWYTGTITRAGVKIRIDFDDGNHAIVSFEDFKDVKPMLKSKKSKKGLTTLEARDLYVKVKPPKPGTPVVAKRRGKEIYPSLIGKYIQFINSKNMQYVKARVLQQLPGKVGPAPRYRAKLEGATSTWTIPHRLVLEVHARAMLAPF